MEGAEAGKLYGSGVEDFTAGQQGDNALLSKVGHEHRVIVGRDGTDVHEFAGTRPLPYMMPCNCTGGFQP